MSIRASFPYAPAQFTRDLQHQRVKESKETNFGYNAATCEYEDLVKAGVIDPTKVVRSAIQNASSIASLLLTTEAMVSEIPEEKKEAPMPQGGGMGGCTRKTLHV